MNSRTVYDKIWEEHLVATRADGASLLYIDRRMRLEALDVVLLREAQTNPAPRN